jgi:hypothetical protein
MSGRRQASDYTGVWEGLAEAKVLLVVLWCAADMYV